MIESERSAVAIGPAPTVSGGPRLATVLAIVPAAEPSITEVSAATSYTIEVVGDAVAVIASAEVRSYDLLVLAGMTVDRQQEITASLQLHRRWRLVPVLFVGDESAPGVVIPNTYRPEIDNLARGTLASVAVQRKIRGLVREGVSTGDLVIAGTVELDVLRGRLKCGYADVELTGREAQILAFLMARANRTASLRDIIAHNWGAPPDRRHQQILRRHISNLRHKLALTPAAGALRTARGAGYRFDLKALPLSVPA